MFFFITVMINNLIWLFINFIININHINISDLIRNKAFLILKKHFIQIRLL